MGEESQEDQSEIEGTEEDELNARDTIQGHVGRDSAGEETNPEEESNPYEQDTPMPPYTEGDKFFRIHNRKGLGVITVHRISAGSRP